ncbi:acute regulatory, mitochondrial-like [Podarcis lilfordi]|uniref:Acute regulatory, mitochondrial-like n=1 Tax=Podarcis lilfordi TaxID=74358 RepID=A0AA35JZ79_9SAUR|nr:acute regulatory, mitochondrial-like [Podarcis lilfordi]
MDIGQGITSAIKKQKRRGSKKKRLTFEDEVPRIEEHLKPKDISPQVFIGKGTAFLSFGFRLIKSYTQQGLDIIGATYSNRSKRLVLLDGKGFFSLDLLPTNCSVRRELEFPKSQLSSARIITYSEKYNVYFVLQKDFSIKVYNKDYNETCSVENPGFGRLTFLSFNPVRDELIGGGIMGVKIWKFKEKRISEESNIYPMCNYGLFPSREYPHMGKRWCTNMDFDVLMQRYYCFSECHFTCYNINGKMLFEIPNAHTTEITSCVYSSDVNVLVTSCKGNEIKSWSDQGSLLHTFQGHSKTVTKLLLHPNSSSLFISGSLDGSVKLWSFDTMDIFYSISPFKEGIRWIGTVDDNFLYCCSPHNLHIYDLNSFTTFWTRFNSPITKLYVCSAHEKSSRVVAMGADNSLRIFSLQDGETLCTVLPPPYPPLIQPVLSFTYNRASGTVFFLLTPSEIWVYTVRTNPACRAAVWTIGELQQHLYRKHPFASCIQKNEHFQHTRKRNFRTSVKCECLCSLSSPLCYLIDEGVVFADNQEFLVLGMQDGRILFLHTSVQNLVYYEMTAYTDPVVHLRHDVAHQQLIIMCQSPRCKLIHFRSLPGLELMSQVNTANDTIVFTRLSNSLFIGLTSGSVDVLNIKEDNKTTLYGKDVKYHGKNEEEEKDAFSDKYHNGPVLAVDSCKNYSLFLSCGSDSTIKLWDTQKNLVADITLDNTLSTACFLNSSGDILLAFKNDIYVLSHSKTLGLLNANIDASSISATESYIFESQPPEELERGKTYVSKPVEMASYLVPYKGYTFTEDFTSDLLVLPKKKGKPVWRLPVAPSAIYCSPCSSDVSLNIFDFLLQPGTPDLEERDKAEMSERMVVTDDKKYVPGPKFPAQTHLEIPFFGVSPCSSVICEEPKTETQPKEQVASAESELPIVEPVQEIISKELHSIKEETVPEAAEDSGAAETLEDSGAAETLEDSGAAETLEDSGAAETLEDSGAAEAPEDSGAPESKQETIQNLKKKRTLECLDSIPHIDSLIYGTTKERYLGKDRLFKHVKEPKKLVPKKLLKIERLSLKMMRTPKHAKNSLLAKNAMRSRDHTYASCAQSAISLGQKQFPALGTEGLVLADKRPHPRKKTVPQENESYESSYERDIIRVVAWRRKQNERIRQAEERRLMQEHARRSCSRNHCFTPSNSLQYQNLQSPENFPENLFAWMKPYRQHQGRPYTVMEETTINLPREFPYRLAWGTPTTQDVDIKLYRPKVKFDKERKISSLHVEKNLQPTQSIPARGRFILVNDPVGVPSTPPLSPLESRLLSARFPKQKEKILNSLFTNVQEPF